MGRKMAGGALMRIPDGGPIDTFRHKFKNSNAIKKHVNTLMHNKQIADRSIQEEANNIRREEQLLSEQKQYDEKVSQDRQDKAHEEYERRRAENIDRMNRASDDSFAFMGKSANGIGTVSAFVWRDVLLNFITALWKGITDLFSGSWKGITDVTKGSYTAVSEPLGLAMKPILEGLVALLLVVMVILIIVLIFVLIFGAFSKGEDDGFAADVGYGEEEKCKDGRIPNTVNINLHNFGKFYNSDKISSELPTSLDTYVQKRQQYLKVPSMKYSIGGVMEYAMGSMVSNETVQWCINSVKYARNYAVNNVNNVTGNKSDLVSNMVEREEEKRGRCDNILNVDSNMFADHKLLKDRNIGNVQTVVNIGRPKDIEWDMPEVEYTSTDYKKLPPSLTSKKDEKNISLDDKRTIVIPWVTKNNSYVLSTDDAYFKSNASEKANVFIDNDDFTCSINTESKARVFSEDKKRYKATNDLSAFI